MIRFYNPEIKNTDIILTIVKITVSSSAILQRHSLRVVRAEWRWKGRGGGRSRRKNGWGISS